MGNTSQAVAERMPTAVWLNLGDLERLMDALARTTARRHGRADPEDRPLIAKIERARNRRLRAVSRAG